MTVRERMLALSLLEKAAKKPDYAKRIGLDAYIKTNSSEKTKVRGVKNA